MEEFKASMLPSDFEFETGEYSGAWVWGYVMLGADVYNTRTYTGPVMVATRGVPIEFKFVSDLGSTVATNMDSYLNAIDRSLHWANPNGVPRCLALPYY